MITLTIDGHTVSVPKGTTVYTACKQLGADIPIFCYHDRMPPFGACRVCLVEVEKMPKLQASCTLEATEGMVVRTQSALARDGRKEILEFLLINHPLDCPICDRAGECPLQEHTYQHGPGTSRFFEDKRRFKKPWSLGPVLMLDRERCIACARCTRFSDLISGDHALEFIDRGYKTQVGTPNGRPAESKFIGNTIMICPVGALTSQVYRFRARPWDNQTSASSCTLCPVGCSLAFDTRDGEIMRTRSRENKQVNDIWLCDKGWFGYEFANDPNRIHEPLIRINNQLKSTTWEHALSVIAEKIQQFKPAGKLAALGGCPLTVEENYLLQKLMREGLGVHHVDYRVGMPNFTLAEEGLTPGMEISIGDVENLSFVVLFGIDLTEEFPIIWLRLKQAINKGAQVLFFGHFSPEIDTQLSKVVVHPPGKELSTLKEHLPWIADMAAQHKQGAFFLGRQYLHSTQRLPVLSELLKLKQALPHLSINLLEAQENSLGARFAGMHPELNASGLPAEKPGMSCLEVLESAVKDHWDFLYVVGANPAQKISSQLWNNARENLRFLVVQDLFLTETAKQADIVLPTLSFIEKEGHMINIEGRVQKIRPSKALPQYLYSDQEIFMMIAQHLNLTLTLDISFLEKLHHGSIIDFKQKKELESKTFPSNRDNLQNTLDTLVVSFAPALFDTGMRMRHNPHLLQLVKQPRVRIHPQEAAKRNIQEGTTIQLSASGYTLEATVHLDPRVALETIVLPLGFEELPSYNLSINLLNGLPIEIENAGFRETYTI